MYDTGCNKNRNFFRNVIVIIILKQIAYQRNLAKTWNLFFWIVEGLTLAVVIVTLIAIILSKEGVDNLVTVETIQSWFLES